MEQIQCKSKEELLVKLNKARSEKLREKFSPVPENEHALWKFANHLFPEQFTPERTPLIEMADILLNTIRYSLGYEGYDEYKKVILTPYPRFRKSFLVSIACVYCFIYAPERSVMRNSATAKLSEKFSRDIRNMFSFDDDMDKNAMSAKKKLVVQKVRELAPDVELSKDKKSLDAWALNMAEEFSYICAGVGGQITGFGCNMLLILDDPYKDEKQYLQENYTEDLSAWYDNPHRARADVSQKVGEIIIMARWGDGDLVDVLTSNEDDWKVFGFDALNDDCTASRCEAMIPTDIILRKMNNAIKNGNERTFNAQYRSKIDVLKNAIFPEDELRRYKESDLEAMENNGGYHIAYMDFADTGEDYLSMPDALVYNGDVYITPRTIFTQEDSKISIGKLVNYVLTTNFVKLRGESNSGGKQYFETLKLELNKLNFIPSGRIDIIRNDTSKHTRILALSGTILKRCVFLCKEDAKKYPEYKRFLEILVKYKKDGSYKKDDPPDSLAGLLTLINVNNSFSIS